VRSEDLLALARWSSIFSAAAGARIALQNLKPGATLSIIRDHGGLLIGISPQTIRQSDFMRDSILSHIHCYMTPAARLRKRSPYLCNSRIPAAYYRNILSIFIREWRPDGSFYYLRTYVSAPMAKFSSLRRMPFPCSSRAGRCASPSAEKLCDIREIHPLFPVQASCQAKEIAGSSIPVSLRRNDNFQGPLTSILVSV